MRGRALLTLNLIGGIMKLQYDLKEKWISQIIKEMMEYNDVTLAKYDEQQYLEVQRLIRIGCNEFLATLRRQGADIEIIH